MVPIGDHPILWHIMQTYSHYGFKRFILCLGYKADVIKSYFLNYPTMNSDFTIERFKEAYNADLANGLGNLVARVIRAPSR